VIQQSGGLTERAANAIQVIRAPKASVGTASGGSFLAEQEIVTVSVEDLLEKLDPAANIPVHGGDFVNVPRSAPISVQGEVVKPGELPLVFGKSLTVRDAILQSGGLTEHAGSVIRIARGGGPEMVSVSMEDLYERLKPEANVLVHPGDVVIVSPGLPIVTVGELVKPGEVQQRFGKGSTVRDVVLRSGGLTKQADAKFGLIIRIHADGSPEHIPVNLENFTAPSFADQMLLPNDIVYVPPKIPTKATTIVTNGLAVAISVATQRLIFLGR
jgi:protein involved in polysaccharide export with SLBB domain